MNHYSSKFVRSCIGERGCTPGASFAKDMQVRRCHTYRMRTRLHLSLAISAYFLDCVSPPPSPTRSQQVKQGPNSPDGESVGLPGASSWLRSVPEGIRYNLVYVARRLVYPYRMPWAGLLSPLHLNP